MFSTLKSLRALSDPTRLRLIALLERDELSVNELQEVTRLGQSRISTHLGLLADCELVGSRRDGKRTFYKLEAPAEAGTAEFVQLAIRGAKELPEYAADPASALRAVHGILKPGGQILILDLLQHNFTKARELYGDMWPGFAESDLHHWLEAAGFKKIEISIVAREEQPPHFQTILAAGQRG